MSGVARVSCARRPARSLPANHKLRQVDALATAGCREDLLQLVHYRNQLCAHYKRRGIRKRADTSNVRPQSTCPVLWLLLLPHEHRWPMLLCTSKHEWNCCEHNCVTLLIFCEVCEQTDRAELSFLVGDTGSISLSHMGFCGSSIATSHLLQRKDRA